MQGLCLLFLAPDRIFFHKNVAWTMAFICFPLKHTDFCFKIRFDSYFVFVSKGLSEVLIFLIAFVTRL